MTINSDADPLSTVYYPQFQRYIRFYKENYKNTDTYLGKLFLKPGQTYNLTKTGEFPIVDYHADNGLDGKISRIELYTVGLSRYWIQLFDDKNYSDRCLTIYGAKDGIPEYDSLYVDGYHGTHKYSGNTGDFAEYVFVGKGIKWIGRKTSNHGIWAMEPIPLRSWFQERKTVNPWRAGLMWMPLL